MSVVMQPTILSIHGGMTFSTQEGYLEYLRTKEYALAKKTYWAQNTIQKHFSDKATVSMPRMPLQDNARYEDWKIVFERHLELITGDLILIGQSLGGIFLAQYLAEQKPPKQLVATYLVCPPFDDDLPGEELAGGFALPKNLSRLVSLKSSLTLLFSADDDVVPVSHAEKYRAHLPDARIIIYPSKNGHFCITEFPEIAEMLETILN